MLTIEKSEVITFLDRELAALDVTQSSPSTFASDEYVLASVFAKEVSGCRQSFGTFRGSPPT